MKLLNSEDYCVKKQLQELSKEEIIEKVIAFRKKIVGGLLLTFILGIVITSILAIVLIKEYVNPENERLNELVESRGDNIKTVSEYICKLDNQDFNNVEMYSSGNVKIFCSKNYIVIKKGADKVEKVN